MARALRALLPVVSLIVTAIALAQENRTLSDADLTGRYAMSYSSNYLGYHGDPQNEPRIGSGEIAFDGHGKLSGRNTSSTFGKIGAAIAGTYHVNPNGTGTMTVTTALQDGSMTTTQLNFRFTDPAKIRFASPERALDPMGTARTVGRPTGIMGTLTKE
jgi:hypothetical protein